MLDWRGHLVAGGVPGVGGDAGLRVLVVTPREESDAQRRIGQADRRAGVDGIARIPDLDAGLDVFGRRAHDDELGAAVVDEVVQRHDGHPRRIEPDRQRPPCRAVHGAKIVQGLA